MASRTRIISQSKALYVSPTGIMPNVTPAAGAASVSELSGIMPTQIHRVDTFSFDIDLAGARQDVREFGQLARIGTLTMSELNPSFSVGYYLGDGENEGLLGFDCGGLTDAAAPSSQFISGVMTENALKREKNLYVLTVGEGDDAFSTASLDANGNTLSAATGKFSSTDNATHDVVSFGNCTFNSYTVNFAVGEIPRVDLEGEAQNIQFNAAGSSGLYNPALDRNAKRADTGQFMLGVPSTGDMNVLVLRPEDVTLSLSKNTFDFGGTDTSDMHVQSASIEVPMSRGNIQALGAERAVAKPLEFPINVTLSVSAILKNLSQGSIDKILTGTAGDATTNATIKVKDSENGAVAHHFVLQKAVLDSQNFSVGLDDNETIDMTFSAQIGGPDTTDQGLFYSGAAGNAPVEDYVGGSINRGFYYTKANEIAPYNE
mgnify:CR=1 FL=1